MYSKGTLKSGIVRGTLKSCINKGTLILKYKGTLNIVLITCFKLIVIKGYKRIFINPTGAEKQKILYKKTGVFTLQLSFNFIHF